MANNYAEHEVTGKTYFESEAEHPFLVPGGLRWAEGGGGVIVEWYTGNLEEGY